MSSSSIPSSTAEEIIYLSISIYQPINQSNILLKTSPVCLFLSTAHQFPTVVENAQLPNVGGS